MFLPRFKIMSTPPVYFCLTDKTESNASAPVDTSLWDVNKLGGCSCRGLPTTDPRNSRGRRAFLLCCPASQDISRCKSQREAVETIGCVARKAEICLLDRMKEKEGDSLTKVQTVAWEQLFRKQSKRRWPVPRRAAGL